MTNFIEILYSKKAILKFRGINLLWLVPVFFINVMLLSSPLFGARAATTGETVAASLPGIEEAFSELYDLNETCAIMDIECMSAYNHMLFAGYEFTIEEPETDQYIYIKDVIAIKNDVAITGDAYFLEGYTWELPSDVTADAYTYSILYAVISSTLVNDFFLIFAGQVLQLLLYFLAISALLLVANYKRKKPVIRYTEAVNITILSMLGPALVSAVIGLFFSQFATLVFMTMYSIRMMNVYFGIFKGFERN